MKINVIDAITNDRQPIADAYAGYSSVDNLMGIYKSALKAQTVKLPLNGGSFFNTCIDSGSFCFPAGQKQIYFYMARSEHEKDS